MSSLRHYATISGHNLHNKHLPVINSLQPAKEGDDMMGAIDTQKYDENVTLIAFSKMIASIPVRWEY